VGCRASEVHYPYLHAQRQPTNLTFVSKNTTAKRVAAMGWTPLHTAARDGDMKRLTRCITGIKWLVSPLPTLAVLHVPGGANVTICGWMIAGAARREWTEHARTHTSSHVRPAPAYANMHMHIYIFIYIYIYIYTYIFVHIHKYILCTYIIIICIYTYKYLYIMQYLWYTYIYIFINMFVYVYSDVWVT